MMFEEHTEHDGTTEAHEKRITRCKGCNARIIFLETSSGKRMPVDADTVDPSEEAFVPGKHKSHFATCSKAGDFRRR
jgi:hypothetical protein